MSDYLTFIPEAEMKPELTQFDGTEYNVQKLEKIAADLPTEQYDISDPTALESVTHGKYWKDAKGEFIGPSDLLDAFEENDNDWNRVVEVHPEWQEHVNRVTRANCELPVLVYRGSPIDGIHRLTRALSEKAITLPMKVLKELPSDTKHT